MANDNTPTGPSEAAGRAQADPQHASPIPGNTLLSEVGRGGMGVVYRAFDQWLRREVAVKLLQERFASDPDSAARLFEKDAEAAYAAALELLRQLAAEFPNKPDLRSETAGTCVNLAAAQFYGDEPMNHLRSAVEMGFNDAKGLCDEESFAALRSRADFQELAKSLAAAEKKDA